MSREIKFRIWNDIDKKMVDWSTLKILPTLLVSTANNEQKYYKLMQYTGLKDKNGVEIYEGDILALDNEVERVNYHIYKIEYNSDKARFVGVDGDEISCMPSIVNHHDGAGRYMIIGNIHENPELLEQSK